MKPGRRHIADQVLEWRNAKIQTIVLYADGNKPLSYGSSINV